MNTLDARPQAQTKPALDTENIHDVVIIGAGVVGLATAMYAGRLNLKTVVFGASTEAELPIGGVITLTDLVENYPGFIRLTGTELGEKMRDHALDYPDKVSIFDARVTAITKHGDCFKVHAENGIAKTKTVIFATGAKWRKLTMKGAEEYENKGVHYCALCDGPLFSGKTVAVIGGGDTAAKEALLLADIAEKVYIVYRGDKIRPEPINGDRVAQKLNVAVLNNTNVVEVLGDRFVSGLKLDNPYNESDILPIDAVFGAIGHEPNSELADALGVELNEKREIKIDRHAQTNLKGVFAAGDVGDLHFKQAITGVAEGVIAAFSAFTYIADGNFVCDFEE